MTNKRAFGLTSFQLKWIAIITMLIDHIGYVFYVYIFQYYNWFRIVGRIAFPIFCFLLVEGFVHTRNRRNYALRLGLFCLISEPCYDLAFHRVLYYPGSQNVFFTLLFGFGMIWLMETIWKCQVEQKVLNFLKNLAPWVVAAAACIIAYLLHTDYSYKGILLILVFYIFRQNRPAALAGMCVTNLMSGNRLVDILHNGFRYDYLKQFQLQDAAILAIIPLCLYNGQKGRSLKWFFYFFYPVHLLVLYLIVMAI